MARLELRKHCAVDVGIAGGNKDAPALAGGDVEPLAVDAGPHHQPTLRRLVRPEGVDTTLARVA